jgi:hypothetical protein
MATAGHNIAPESQKVPDQAQGAEYGFPKNQIKAGEVQVPASVAERFEAAKQGAHERTAGTGPQPIDDKHKSGFEEVSDRARNLTAVTEAKVQSGGEADTRHPDVGFPARPNVD